MKEVILNVKNLTVIHLMQCLMFANSSLVRIEKAKMLCKRNTNIISPRV